VVYPALQNVCKKARENAWKCVLAALVVVGLPETPVIYGCLISGPAMPACLTAAGIVFGAVTAMLLAACGINYLFERRDCYRK